MANYLLDSGLVIRHLRGQRHIVQFIRGMGKLGRLSISAVTRLELYAGMTADERYATQKLLSRFVTINLDRDIADRAGDLIQESRGHGNTLDVPDAIIAATAIAHNLILVSLNTTHFERVADLSLALLPDGLGG